ncbi:MAG: hypothetical protein M1833_006751 [Piccolia ochrophora]|nr:MAG: hypothetical protein M1833_006751 [Piccolia ochrophora]
MALAHVATADPISSKDTSTPIHLPPTVSATLNGLGNWSFDKQSAKTLADLHKARYHFREKPRSQLRHVGTWLDQDDSGTYDPHYRDPSSLCRRKRPLACNKQSELEVERPIHATPNTEAGKEQSQFTVTNTSFNNEAANKERQSAVDINSEVAIAPNESLDPTKQQTLSGDILSYLPNENPNKSPHDGEDGQQLDSISDATKSGKVPLPETSPQGESSKDKSKKLRAEATARKSKTTPNTKTKRSLKNQTAQKQKQSLGTWPKPKQTSTLTVRTRFAHPITTFHSPPSDCDWCTSTIYGIAGLGLVTVTVSLPKYTEISGDGHTLQGATPSRMCVCCTFDRLAIGACAQHDMRPIPGLPAPARFDIDAAYAELFAEPPVPMAERTTVWCAVCPSPAFWRCCAGSAKGTKDDPIDLDTPLSKDGNETFPSTGPETEGERCPLLLCEPCAQTLQFEYNGGLQQMLSDLDENGLDAVRYPAGLRGDVEFLRWDSEIYQRCARGELGG